MASCFVLEKRLIRLHVPEESTEKHFVQTFLAASRSDNTLVEEEMETGGIWHEDTRQVGGRGKRGAIIIH